MTEVLYIIEGLLAGCAAASLLPRRRWKLDLVFTSYLAAYCVAGIGLTLFWLSGLAPARYAATAYAATVTCLILAGLVVVKVSVPAQVPLGFSGLGCAGVLAAGLRHGWTASLMAASLVALYLYLFCVCAYGASKAGTAFDRVKLESLGALQLTQAIPLLSAWLFPGSGEVLGLSAALLACACFLWMSWRFMSPGLEGARQQSRQAEFAAQTELADVYLKRRAER